MSEPRKVGRKPATRITIDLQLPPDLPVASQEHAVWRQQAAIDLINLNRASVRGYVGISVKVGHGPDGSMPTILNRVVSLLSAYQVISDPRYVVDLIGKWDRTIEPGRALVSIWTTRPANQRLTAGGRRRVSEALTSMYRRRGETTTGASP